MEDIEGILCPSGSRPHDRRRTASHTQYSRSHRRQQLRTLPAVHTPFKKSRVRSDFQYVPAPRAEPALPWTYHPRRVTDDEGLSFIRQRSFARYIMFDLADAARKLAWEVEWLDLEGRLFASVNLPTKEKGGVIVETIEGIERFNPDLIFSYGLEYLDRVFQSYVPGLDTRLNELVKRPAVFFLCDFGFPFTDRSDPAFREYVALLQGWNSLVLCWDQELTDTLKQMGISRAQHFPLAVNREMFHPGQSVPSSEIPVLFVGGPSDERIRILEPITDLGLAIHAYDPAGWTKSAALRECYRGEILERDHLRATYQRANICINVTRPHGPSSLNMRVFEAMACGSLVLTDDRVDARRLFKEGVEIVIYRDPHDLRNKVAYYSQQDDARHAISQAGMHRVVTNYTYADRLRSAEASIVQFHRESRALTMLAEFVRNDPAKATRFARYLTLEAVIESDTENLRLLEAKAHLALDNTAQAEASLSKVLDINPRHVEAETCHRQLRGAA